MPSVITNAFQSWNVNKILADEPAVPDQMIFALVPGLDAGADVDPNEGLPPAAQISYVSAITHKAALNTNAVVYSAVLDTTIGDWRYNWIGLVDSATSTVLMIVHIPEQLKIKTQGGQQGNNLVRNLAMEFAGAAEATQITVTPETWQIDYSARLRSMDESRRVARVDYYGSAAFDGGGFAVSVNGGTATIAPGLGYVAGLRVYLEEAATVAAANTAIWIDAVWSGTVTGAWKYGFTIRTGAALTDYVDAAGYPHFVAKIATIAGGVVTDERSPFPLQRIEQEISDLDVYDKTEADQRFLRIENNLSDLGDVNEAREILGFNMPDGPVFRAIIDAVFWVGRSVISDSNPQEQYTWQKWRDLSADYGDRVLRISDEAMKTGGSNSVKIEGNNLPPHWHRSGDRSPGTVWDPDTTHGTDNQKSGPLALTEGTFIDSAGKTESANEPIDVTNEYVTVRVWRRTA